jgi:cellulose synthase/poly-beta-1,6-N-acetylglucosamine synthase-like glycosyltransferase
MNELQLNDIKNLVQIPDYSIYFYYGLIMLIISIFIAIIYIIYNYLKNRKQNIRKIYFKKLKSVDFKNSKQSAYKITKYGYLLVKTHKEKQFLEDLIDQLDKYKYKKNVPIIDDNVKNSFHIFMDILNV